MGIFDSFKHDNFSFIIMLFDFLPCNAPQHGLG